MEERICQNCKTVMEEDAKFCPKCGTPVDTPFPAAEESAETSAPEETKKKKIEFSPKVIKIIKKAVGFTAGTAIILIGLIQILSAGTSISSASFGADFYTYTYRGIVAIGETLASIHTALGWLILSIGATIDVITLRD